MAVIFILDHVNMIKGKAESKMAGYKRRSPVDVRRKTEIEYRIYYKITDSGKVELEGETGPLGGISGTCNNALVPSDGLVLPSVYKVPSNVHQPPGPSNPRPSVRTTDPHV